MSRDVLPPSLPPSSRASSVLRVLVVEDNPGDAELIRDALGASAETDLRHVDRLGEAIRAVEQDGIDVVLLDLSLPDAVGLEGLIRLRAAGPHAPIVVLTGLTDEALGVAAVQQGAEDYLFKGDLRPAVLRRALRYAVERHEFLKRETLLAVEQAARVEAEAVNRMKDEFLATLSHELRTPLNAIVGWTEVLRRRGSRTGDDAKALAAIARNAGALTRLITDLLDVSRIASGQVRIESHDVDPAGIVRAAVDSVTPMARAKGVSLAVVAGGGGALVKADPARLLQVVSNLVGNAVKFTPASGEVRISVRRVDAEVTIVVEDTGIGFSSELVPHLFERFWQAEGSTQRQHGGLGLGLTIVKQLTELQGGTVEARSAGAGEGAVFTLRFPAVAGGREARAGGAEEAPPDLSDVRILVVEDEADSRELMRVVLEERGARVLTAASAREALDIVRYDGRLDALLVDLGLPDEDGYALLRRIRELPVSGAAEIPVAAVTAFASAEDERRVFRAGFTGYLGKPVTPGDAVALVATMVGSPRNCAGRAPS